MRRLMILAPVVALALVSANCSGGAFNSPTSPGVDVTDSATEARGGGGGGGKKPGGGSGGGGTTDTGSLALVMVNDANGDGAPNWGEIITFTVTTTATRPFVSVQCYQSGTRVYSGSVGFFPDYAWPQQFTLSSLGWSSGAADCMASIYTSLDGTSTTTVATMNFYVGA